MANDELNVKVFLVIVILNHAKKLLFSSLNIGSSKG